VQNGVVGLGGGLKTNCHSRPSPHCASEGSKQNASDSLPAVSQNRFQILYESCLIGNVSLRTDPLKRAVPYNSWLEIE
jgi:hypothetical protein